MTSKPIKDGTHTHTHKSSHKKLGTTWVFFVFKVPGPGLFLSAWFAVHSPIFTSRTALNMEAAPNNNYKPQNWHEDAAYQLRRASFAEFHDMGG